MNILDNIIIYYLVNKNHFDKKRAIYYLDHMKTDWKDKSISLQTKLWATKRGFFPSRVLFWGLNDDNYKYYVSDFQYRGTHPLNNHFAFWINDKLTLKYMLQTMIYTNPQTGKSDSLLPEYYLYVENDGHYSYLIDCPNSITKDENFILNLLKEKKILALKPNNGQGGKGFIKLEYYDGNILSNGTILNHNEYVDFLNSINGYIVTEYIKQHPDLDKVWPGSECTLRIIAYKPQSEKTKYIGCEPRILLSYARFGTKLSGGASNMSSGGVGAKYDFYTGDYGTHFYRKRQFTTDGNMILSAHPDTGYILQGKKLPHWDIVKDSVFAICNHLSSLEYFGFDFLISEDGVKLCEINSLPALDIEQIMFGPLLKDTKYKEYLNEKTNKKFHVHND